MIFGAGGARITAQPWRLSGGRGHRHGLPSAHSRRLEGVVAAAMLLSDVCSNAGVVSTGVLTRPTAFGGLTLDALSAPPIACE